MTEAQEKATVALLQNITHLLVERVRDIAHEDRVQLLDDLCSVKREFGMNEAEANPT